MIAGRDRVAYDNVPRFLNETFGKGGWRTEKRPRDDNPGQMSTWVLVGE